MKANFIQIKLNNRCNNNLERILELYKLSVGNNKINLNYNINKKESSNQNLEIIYYKKYNKNNIGKMKYEATKNKEIFHEFFISNNKNRAKMIINNKQYILKENFRSQKYSLKIKIKFLDIIIFLNCMFKNCDALYSVDNFRNLNTKYLKTIYQLFAYCNSLKYIDDISKWNTSNINNMSFLFAGCTSLINLPDISKWNLSNTKNISGMFDGCSSLVELPDISNWNIERVINISLLFRDCSKIKYLPDISNWNTNRIRDIKEIFSGCTKLESLPDISKWNISNTDDISGLFSECSSLKNLPDISNWRTNNINYLY